MKKPQTLVTVAALLWAVILANPYGRAIIQHEIRFHKWVLDPDNSDISDAWIDLNSKSSSIDDAQKNHPDNRDVQLALFSDDDKQKGIMAALAAKYPDDPAVIAIDLEVSGADLHSGRQDDPIANPYWPAPNREPKSSIVRHPTSASADWLAFLKLARHGAALEPDNTYFDWMQLAALCALHRDQDALTLVNASAGKTRYNEHFGDQRLAQLHAQELDGSPPLDQIVIPTSIYQAQDSQLLSNPTRTLVGRIIELRMQGKEKQAITTSFSLLKLTSLVRDQSYLLDDSTFGLALEGFVLVGVDRRVPGRGRPEFAPLGPPNTILNRPANLAGYAQAYGESWIAQQVVSEVKTYERWANMNYFGEDNLPGQKSANVASGLERFGHLILESLCLPTALLALASLGSWRWPPKEPKSAVPALLGTLLGMLVLLLLAAADAGLARQIALSQMTIANFRDIVDGPGLDALAPFLTFQTVAVALVLLAFSRARRPTTETDGEPSWRDPFRQVLSGPGPALHHDTIPVFRLGMQWIFWASLVALYLYFCFGSGFDMECRGFLLEYNAPLAREIPGALSILVLCQWLRSSDRAADLKLSLLNIRRLTGAYVLTALLICAVVNLATTAIDIRFHRNLEAYLKTGQTARVRHKLGL